MTGDADGSKRRINNASFGNIVKANYCNLFRNLVAPQAQSLDGDEKVDKNSELVKMIKAWVDKEYEDGRVTVLCDYELENVVAEACTRLGITLK